jgi:acetolactate synthase small subunit
MTSASVFAYRAGKDPFFPNRRLQDDKATPQPHSTKPQELVLRGVTGSADRRVALINDLVFTKGETGKIKVGTNTFRIRVIDIREKSVIIDREGQPRPLELPLIENLLPLKP